MLSPFLDYLKLAVAAIVMLLAAIAHSPYGETLAGMCMNPPASVAALEAKQPQHLTEPNGRLRPPSINFNQVLTES